MRKRFKLLLTKVCVFAVGMALAVGLGACGNSDMHQTKNEVYLSVVHQQYPQTNTPAWNRTLVNTAHRVCAALNRGVSPAQIRQVFVSYASGPSEARMFGYIVGAGVKVYCPQYSNQISS